MEKKKHSKGVLILVLLLILLVLASGAVLWAKIGDFTKEQEPDLNMTLMPGDGQGTDLPVAPTDSDAAEGETTLPAGTQETTGPETTVQEETTLPETTPGQARPQVRDDAGAWGKETQVEIFRVHYENGEGVITVASADGEKVVAPGTEHTYTFRVMNNGNASMKYWLTGEAVLTDGEQTYTIPLQGRVRDGKGNYYLGSVEEWVPLEELGVIRKNRNLAARHQDTYTLDWRWLFEAGQDEYDTMLGDLAAERDLILTVRFTLRAESNTDPNAPGGSPTTGDSMDIYLYISLMAVSLLAIVLLLLLNRNKRSARHD